MGLSFINGAVELEEDQFHPNDVEGEGSRSGFPKESQAAVKEEAWEAGRDSRCPLDTLGEHGLFELRCVA